MNAAGDRRNAVGTGPVTQGMGLRQYRPVILCAIALTGATATGANELDSAELVGLAYMMPVTVTVERTWRGTAGAMVWWIDDIIYDEQTRLAERRWPVDLDAWGAQVDRMWIFAELVHDTDRHGGNLLYTRDWKLHMVDFTRAFQAGHELMKSYRLRRIDPMLLARLEALSVRAVAEATEGYLSREQITTVLRRRDILVEHFCGLIPEVAGP